MRDIPPRTKSLSPCRNADRRFQCPQPIRKVRLFTIHFNALVECIARGVRIVGWSARPVFFRCPPLLGRRVSTVASDVDPFFERPKFFVRRSTGGVKFCKLSHLLYVHGTDLRLLPQSTTIGSGVMSSGNVAMGKSSFVEKIVSVHRYLIPTEVEGLRSRPSAVSLIERWRIDGLKAQSSRLLTGALRLEPYDNVRQPISPRLARDCLRALQPG